MVPIHTCATDLINFSPNETMCFCLVHVSLLFFSIPLSTFLSMCVEKEEERKVHRQCKGSDTAGLRSSSLPRSAQVHLTGLWTGLEPDCCGCRTGMVYLNEVTSYERNPPTYWESSITFRVREQTKVRSERKLHNRVLRLNIRHCFFSGLHISTPAVNSLLSVTLLLFFLLFSPKSQNTPVLESERM